jgi:hypothetical protein
MKRKTLSNRTFISMIVAIVLLVVMCAGATYAYFTDTISSATKTLTFGEVAISETGHNMTSTRVSSADKVLTDKLMPGDSITIAGVVKNDKEAAYVRVSYTLTFENGATTMTAALAAEFTAQGWEVAQENSAYTGAVTLTRYYALQGTSKVGGADAADGYYTTSYTHDATHHTTSYAETGNAASMISKSTGSDAYDTLDIGLVILVPTSIGNAAINKTVTLNVTIDAIQQANIVMADGTTATAIGTLSSRDTTPVAITWDTVIVIIQTTMLNLN